MFFIADFHIHTKYSRATSPTMNLESIYKWAQLKGIKLIGTGDFTHPDWFLELKEKLEPAEPGLYKLKKEFVEKNQKEVPDNCQTEMRYILTAEISCIYSKNGKTRKVHNLIFAPSLEIVEKINHKLSGIGNLAADGRPILGLDSKELLKIILDTSPECFLVPAHAWTPHFSVFGSNSGFDSLEECFEEMTSYIFAIETGLSSDPAMNWRLSQLDNIALISNSDAHSPSKLGREANIFDTDMTYLSIFQAIKNKNPQEFLMTIEFFPEEGKYHYDGHRNCKICFSPQETIKKNYTCPNCGRALTIGVMHRVEKLADRKEGESPTKTIPYKSLIPLVEIIAEAFEMGVESQKVQSEYQKLIRELGNELRILLKTPILDLEKITNPLIAEGIKRVREGNAKISPGYDGEYGKINLFDQEEKSEFELQASLF